jgi:L-malate glycosyltransferase
MRICFLADIRSIHTKRWIEFFAINHEIHLITLDYPKNEMTSVKLEDYTRINVKIHTIPKSFPNILFNSFRVRNLVWTIKPDLLHAHFVTHYGYWGSKSRFHPFVVTAWGDDVLIHPKTLGLAYLVNHALQSADLITCDGENSFRAILGHGIAPEKIKLITHGVDTNKFSPDVYDPDLFCRIFKNRFPVVISIRGFNPIYNPETLIRAIPLVIKEKPNVNFMIAGQGYDEEKLKILARDLGADANITFCGWISHDNLPPYLASADIYVSLALSDGGVAVSTFEAMSSGLAVIVTETGDNRLWIQNDVNGYIIPVRSPENLAEKILYLLRHPSVLDTFGAANRTLVEEKQDYYKEMEKVHVLYKGLVRR